MHVIHVINSKTSARYRYMTKRKLGRGAGASVYLAEKFIESDESTDEQNTQGVAIKIAETLKEKSLLRKEAIILKKLSKNADSSLKLVRVHEDGEILEEYEAIVSELASEDDSEETREQFEYQIKHNGCSLIELEYLPGKTLDAWMREDWFPREEVSLHDTILTATAYIQDLLAAISQLSLDEEQLIIHRDIKPSNVMVNDQGLRLFDFNAAREEDPVHEMTYHIGTPGYWAPEISRGPNYDRRADMFSVGVIFWELLHRRFFNSDRPSLDVMVKPGWKVDWPTPGFEQLPESVGARLERLLTGLLCHQDDRFRDASLAFEHAVELRAALSSLQPPVEPDSASIEAESVRALDVIATIMELNPGGQAAVVADIDPTELGALQSYVRTRTRVLDPLEQYLGERVRAAIASDDGPKLLLLAGNAGDGKSYLIERLVYELLDEHERQQITYVADATHSLSPTQSQFERLGEFFKPFVDGSDGPDDGTLHIIAMNTGMVIRYFEEVERSDIELGQLAKELERQLGLRRAREGDTPYPHKVEVINLDLRSMIQRMRGLQQSFFEEMLDRLDPRAEDGLLGPKMNQCNECPARTVCPVYFNLHALRQDTPRRVLVNLLERTELDPEVHLSPRNLWGFLYRLITGGVERFALSDRKQDESPCDVVRRKYQSRDFRWMLEGHFYMTAFSQEHIGGIWASLSRHDPTYASTFGVDRLHTRFSVRTSLDADVTYIDEELGGKQGILCGTELDSLLSGLGSGFDASRRRDIAVRRHIFFRHEAFEEYRRDMVREGLLPFEKLLKAYRRFSQTDQASASNLSEQDRTGIKALCQLIQRVTIRAYGYEIRRGGIKLLQVSQPNVRASSRLYVRVDDNELRKIFNPTNMISPDVHVRAHIERSDLLGLYGYLPDTITLNLEGYRLVVDENLYEFLQEVEGGKQPSALDLSEFQALRYVGERLGNVLASRAGASGEFYMRDQDGRFHTLRQDDFGCPEIRRVEGV